VGPPEAHHSKGFHKENLLILGFLPSCFLQAPPATAAEADTPKPAEGEIYRRGGGKKGLLSKMGPFQQL